MVAGAEPDPLASATWKPAIPSPVASPLAWSPIHRYRGWPFQVTWPPEIVANVPVTPGPAVGVPVAVSGGHAVAHPPVQALVVAPAVSLPNV